MLARCDMGCCIGIKHGDDGRNNGKMSSNISSSSVRLLPADDSAIFTELVSSPAATIDTVPAGKTLYITDMQASNTSTSAQTSLTVYVNGNAVFSTSIGPNASINASGLPIFIATEGEVVTATGITQAVNLNMWGFYQ
jgi:hypothetical protein